MEKKHLFKINMNMTQNYTLTYTNEFVDDLSRVLDKRYSCIVCVDICTHLLRV